MEENLEAVPSPSRPPGPRAYIIADMEGATGITRREQIEPGCRAWEEARHELTADVNSVIRGAIAGGASTVLVRDSHAYGFNLLVDDLEPGIEYVGGQYSSPVPIWGDLAGAQLAFYVAGHARCSTPDSFEPHTLRHRFVDLRIQGKSVCELELFGAQLGEHGVRMGFFSGEEIACTQAAESLPWIQSVAITKDTKVYEQYGKIMGQRLRERLYRGALEAVTRFEDLPLFTYPGPITLEVTYLDEEMAQRENRWGFPREGRTVILRRETFSDVMLDLLKLGYLSPRTWPFRDWMLRMVRWYQGLKAGCLP